MNPQRRTVAEQFAQCLGRRHLRRGLWRGGGFFALVATENGTKAAAGCRRGKAVLLFAIEKTETVQPVNDEEHRLLLRRGAVQSLAQLVVQVRHRIAGGSVVDDVGLHLQPGHDPPEHASARRVAGGAVENDHARRRLAGGGKRYERSRQYRRCRFLLLTHDEQVGPSLSAKGDMRRRLDRHRFAEIRHVRARRLAALGRDKLIVVGKPGRRASLEDGRLWNGDVSLRGFIANARQCAFTLGIRQPCHLERTVVLHRPAGIVVNRLAWPTQQSRRGVAVAQHEPAVGFAALQRDAHRDLPERGTRKSRRPADRLAAEHDVHAERATLPNEAVDEQRRILRELVIIAEKLMKFVNHQQDARHRLIRLGRPEAGQVLHPGRPEQVAATGQFLIEPLQDA